MQGRKVNYFHLISIAKISWRRTTKILSKSPNSTTPRSCGVHKESDTSLWPARLWTLSFLTAYPGFLLCSSLLGIWLPRWLAFCTLPAWGSFWCGGPCACCSLRLSCFSLVSLYSIHLYWKYSLGESPT